MVMAHIHGALPLNGQEMSMKETGQWGSEQGMARI